MDDYRAFTEWLHQQIAQSGKTQAELAYAGDISASQISRVLSGDRNPGPDFCLGIAKALNLPPEVMFQKAGLFPETGEEGQKLKEAGHLFGQLPEREQDMILAVMHTLLKARARREERRSADAEAV